MTKKKSIAMICIATLLIAFITIGATYAYWRQTLVQTGTNELSTGCLNVSLTNEENDIKLIGTVPMSDEDGDKLTPYTFTVSNTCENDVYYSLGLDVMDNSTLANQYVKVNLNNNFLNLSQFAEGVRGNVNAKENKILTTGKLEASESKDFSLKLYLDGEKAVDENSMNKTFDSKITITAEMESINVTSTGSGDDYVGIISSENTKECTCQKVIKYTCTESSEQLANKVQYTEGSCPGDGNYGPRDSWNVTTEGHTSCTGATYYKKVCGPKKLFELVTDVNGNGVADVWDEVALDDQNFYILSDDGVNVSMLTKYNLYVGKIYDGASYDTMITIEESDPMYAMQYADAKGHNYFHDPRGWDTMGYPFIGVTTYGPDNNYQGSNVQKFNDDYVNKLNTMYSELNATASAITRDQLTALSCSTSSYSCNVGTTPEWFYDRSFWIDIQGGTGNVWDIVWGGYVNKDAVTVKHLYGVRPVLTISSDLLK